MSQDLLLALVILGIIVLGLLILAILYYLFSIQRRLRLYRKADRLLEDLTYKLETLTPAVEAIARFANYLDLFEATSRKSIKALVRLVARNRDEIYRVWARIKQAVGLTGETKPSPKSGQKPKEKRDR